MIEVTMRFEARDARFTAPFGVPMPEATPVSFTAEGAHLSTVWSPDAAQHLAVGVPDANEVVLRWQFSPEQADYPEALFAVMNNRFTRAAEGIAGETRAIAAAAGGGAAGLQAIVDHVAQIFDYGHPTGKFYDGYDEIPHLCDRTEGSCVDINAYLIAALRAAGYQAGYLYGLFVPEEKQDWCEDGHCWVATRHNGIVQDWDIAHHLKMGRRSITPGLNPKPGVRLPLAHSMGWSLPALGLNATKVLGIPLWLTDAGPRVPDDLTFRLEGYDQLVNGT
jgi:hypothetical protein